MPSELNLTRPQKQILAMESYVGGAASNICGYLLWDSVQDYAMLNRALNGLMKQNDALRLRLLPGAEARQIIEEYVRKDAERRVFPDERAFREYMEAYGKKPFERYGPLMEAWVAELPGKTAAVMKIHHLLADGWSLSLVAQQFASLLNGGEPEAGSYADYVRKEQDYLSGSRYQKDAAFFVKQVETHPDRTLLCPRAAASFQTETLTFTLSRERNAAIRSYLEQAETTPFVFFLSLISTVYYRFTGQPASFFIGTPVLNRFDTEDQNTVGMFVNNIPLLMEPDGGSSFGDNLSERVEDACYQAFRHQRCNYTDLTERLGDQAAGLYDVLFSYHIEDVGEGQTFTLHQLSCGAQPETLQIHMEDRMHTGELAVHYDYRTEKITPAEIRRFHRCLERVMEQVLEDDSIPLNRLELRSPEDIQWLSQWNHPDEAEDASLYPLLEAELIKDPEKPCLFALGQTLSRRQFLDGVFRLDNELRARIPEGRKPVAVLCDRGVEMVTALYAILRSGNIYVPLSPEYPDERLRCMTEDCGAVLILTQRHLLSRCGDRNALDIGEILQNPTRSAAALPPALTGSDLAYILYTSGSTGMPKGAMITHRALRNRILWMQRQYPLSGDDVLFQKTPFTFDVSLWEFLWWSLGGAGLAVCPPGEHFLPERLTEQIGRHGVTHIHFVPSVFRLFIDWLGQHPEALSALSSLKHIFLSGEAAAARSVNRCRALLGQDIAIHNLYGPTECAVDVTYYDCLPEEQDPIPIGRPIDNVSCYVADENLQLLPCGIAGELLIGGANVGAGYIGKPEPTAESFLPNPFGEGMVYRTGDRVLLREDGELLFLGRNDGQLKLNGQRLELGEIESTILRCPGVSAAIVWAEEDVLSACCTGQLLSRETLLRHCLASLPRYMVPKIWYHAAALPLNGSGKIDRAAVPGTEKTLCSPREADSPPRDELEAALCRKFAVLLKTDAVDRETDFLLSGGSSLDVVSLLSEPELQGIRTADFLAAPTPTGLAELLRGEKRRDAVLNCLYEPEEPGKAVLLFPYAGGDAAAFSALTAALRRKHPEIGVYYTDYPHSEPECRAIADAISALAKQNRVSFYAHCVGAAPAMLVLSMLEEKGDNCVCGCLAAGLLLPEAGSRTGSNPWRRIPRRVLEALLKKSGAPAAFFRQQGESSFYSRFLSDTDFYFSHAAALKRVHCPVSLLFSRHDLFTRGYERAAELWQPYCENLRDITLLDGKGHYFQRNEADRVADSIADTF